MTTASERESGMGAGLTWTLAAMLATRLVTLVGLAVLARLLAPDDFGLLAFALAYITYVTAIGDLGTGAALIYWPSRNGDAAQVTFVVGVVTGLLCLGGTVVLAPAIAAFFDNPTGAPVLIAIAWSVPIQAFGSTHDALCRKSLRFRAWFAPELALAAGKAIISVVLALAGLGVWSLVWGHLAGHLLRTILLWTIVPWRPALTMPWHMVGPMFRYGRSIVALNVLSVIVHHSDLLIVGRLLGVTALGFYQMAAKIPEMAITLLVRAVSQVLFPTLSRACAQGQDAVATYLTTLRGVGLVTIPVAVVLVMMAEPLVLVMFGPKWAPSVPALQALAVVACLRALGTPGGDLLKASGRPGVLVVLAATKAVLMVPALVLSARAGMTGVALAMSAVAAITATLDILVACSLTATSGGAVLGSIGPGIRTGVAVAAGVALVDIALPTASPLVFVPVALSTGVVAYACAIRIVSPRTYDDMIFWGRRLASVK
jgi:O-antigen/teichoic acid export membrane protein